MGKITTQGSVTKKPKMLVDDAKYGHLEYQKQIVGSHNQMLMLLPSLVRL
jgi:hypothetical protein